MNKTSLHKLRLIIPGILIFLLFIPLLPNRYEVFKSFLEIKIYINSFIGLIVIVVGVIYYAFNIRNYFFKRPLEEINNNLKNELLKPFNNDKIIAKKLDYLLEGRRLRQVFYNFVDNEKSLTEQVIEVYLNGLILSTSCDICAICLFGSFMYSIVFIISSSFYFFIISVICFFIFIISKFILIKKITKKHIELGNEQINFIVTNLKKQLGDRLRNI